MNAVRPRILITPLNWGLGHATRCIPIIRELVSKDCEVIIGANGAASILLKQEFPLLQHLTTPGKEIRYANKGFAFALSLISQFPGLFKQLYEEKKWIRKTAKELKPDWIISDNCYNLYHSDIPSVLITHQLGVTTGFGKLADGIMRRFLYSLLAKFKEIWVPDWEGNNSFGGALSHPVKMPKVPLYYIGPLNRFDNSLHKAAEKQAENKKKSKLELLILLSGPEPQRSLLETTLKKQLPTIHKTVCLLRGLPGLLSMEKGVKDLESAFTNPSLNDQQLPLLYGQSTVSIYDHLPANQLQTLIQDADIILCRSGYTSLMELLPLKKKLIVVPTPGQPEQNYLAAYYQKQGYALAVKQKDLELKIVLEQAAVFPFTNPSFSDNTPLTLLQQRVAYYLRSLQ